MNILLLSLGLIVLGGLLPLAVLRRLQLMNALGTILVVLGCGLGLLPAFDALLNGGEYAVYLSRVGVFPLSFRLDSISGFFLVPVLVVSLLGRVYGSQYLGHGKHTLGVTLNHFFYSLLVASMVLVVYAGNLFSFAISWEAMSVSSFFLVIYDYQKESTRKAALIYFAFTQAGALLIFAGFGILAAVTGTLGFDGFSGLSSGIKLLVFLLLLCGFGSKAGMFPLHIWLPYAHPAAPSHVSAVMSGVMIKMGIYGIIRFYCLLDTDEILLGQIILFFGIASGVFGVVQALGQHHLKRLLAYHSVENIGIILIGLGIGMIGRSLNQPAVALLGFAGAFLHVVNHAIFKSLLFMGAGAVIQQTGIEMIDQLGGVLKKMRITGVTFLVGSVAIAGLPPLNGFISELLIYLAGFHGIRFSEIDFIPSALAIISLALIGGLALACFTKVVGVVFLGEPRSVPRGELKESGIAMVIPMVVLAVLCLLIGVFPRFFIRFSLVAIHAIPRVANEVVAGEILRFSEKVSSAVLLFFLLVAIVWVLRRLLYRGKTVTVSSTWGCGYTRSSPRIQYTGTSFVATLLGFFKPMAPAEVVQAEVNGHFPAETGFHSKIADPAEIGLFRLLVSPMQWIFNGLRWIQHGEIHLYIGYILLAVILLLLFI